MEQLIEDLNNFKLPKYNEIPDIDLYMDQLLSYIDNVVQPIIIDRNEKILTTSMVNNYVKANIIRPTHKKRYSREHVAYLIFISIFKQVYTINELKKLMLIQVNSYTLEEAYNYFCIELEGILKTTFNDLPLPLDSARKVSDKTIVLRTSIIAFANKLYSQKLSENIIEKENINFNNLKNK